MTVIAYRDGVMASDSGAFEGDSVYPWSRKVASGADGALWGYAGCSAIGDEFLKWVLGGYRGPRPLVGDADNNINVLVAHPNGRLRILTQHGEENFDTAPFMALGGAASFAMGALFAGADAETAVQASIEFSKLAAGKVQVVRFPA